jgi:hypothetical protein
MTSCVAPIPKRIGTRRPITAKALTFFERGAVHREEVLLKLGIPEETTPDQRLFDYKWIGATEWITVGPGMTGSVENQQCNILRLHFDEHGLLEQLLRYSYKPTELLRDNRDCHVPPDPLVSSYNIPQQMVTTDQSFIKVGQTIRQEVLQRLGWADVGLKGDRFFWGRWATDSSGAVVILPRALRAVKKRPTVYHNILIEFDQKGAVTRANQVRDEDIVRELGAWSMQTRGTPSSLSHSLYHVFKYTRKAYPPPIGLMSVDADSLKFFDSTQTYAWSTVLRNQIAAFELSPNAGVVPQFALTFIDDRPHWGNKVDVFIDLPDLLTALKYIIPQQANR